ncbi:MAG: DUF861 domain-containing protein [Deltaproteobacteria bacterium]|nr:DUF861 domain-containing protein [Deltaproteobacteria bacterium]MBW2693909.1 DUF861 domain-containing protein [Deltaproteobacteria bacterium]
MKFQWSGEGWGRAIQTLSVLAAACVWGACAGISDADAPERETAEKEYTPVRLDSDKLAGLGLEEYPAMPAEEVLEGGSGHRGDIFFVGDELAVGVWEADASTLAITEPLPYDEFVMVLSGKLILTDKQGTATEYSPGQSVVLPKGFVGTWQMLGNFREIYVMEKDAFMRDDE